MVTSLVLSKINFACTLYFGVTEKQLKRLQKNQNFSARLIVERNRFSHVTSIIKNLKYLKIKDFVKYRFLTMVYAYECLNGTASKYLQEIFIPHKPNRSFRSGPYQNLLKIPILKSNYSRWSFPFCCLYYLEQFTMSLKLSPSFGFF